MKQRGRPSQAALIETLIKVRKTAGLSQPALAKRLQRPQSYITKIEKGRIAKIGAYEVCEWAEACGQDEITVFSMWLIRRARGP